MTEERFILVKCIENQWGIIDYSLEDVDQLILIHTNKTKVSIIVNELNRLNEENEQLKSFIKKLTNGNGEIVLMNGYGYTKSYVKKLLNEKELEK